MSFLYWMRSSLTSGCCGYQEVSGFGFGRKRGEVLPETVQDESGMGHNLPDYQIPAWHFGEGSSLQEAADKCVRNYVKYMKINYLAARHLSAHGGQALRAFYLLHKTKADTDLRGGEEGDCYTPELLNSLMKIEGAFMLPQFMNVNTGRIILPVMVAFNKDTKFNGE